MAGRPPTADLVDPLSVLNGLLLFPRAIRSSVSESVPTDAGDLDSINEFMKSRALRSPEKLMIEAKRIVDSRTAILDSNLVNFAKNANASDAVLKNGKEMPRERRQGLGLARKRAPFTLKTSLSQPVSMEPPMNLDKIQDPDEFFDAYERHEKAKKEMQKQLGTSIGIVNEFKPITKPRLRRQGILGKSYSCRNRYSSVSFENDMLMSSQEVVEQHIPSVPRDEPADKLIPRDELAEKLITQNSNLNFDSEGVESVVSMRKKDIEVNSLSDDLLSCDHEDLDGDGALDLLQERLKIKPLDLENLCIPELQDFQRTNKFSARESLQKPDKTSFVIDNMLKNVNRKQPVDHEHTATNLVIPVALPIPPRSPFASLSFLKNRILQSNPLRDAFSPQNADFSACQTSHPVESIDMLGEHVNETTVSRVSSELESHIGVEVAVPIDTNMDPQKEIGSSDNLPHQFIDENSNKQGEKAGSGPTEVPDFNNIKETINVEQLNDNPVKSIDMLGEHVNETTASVIANELESYSNMDPQKAIGCFDNLPQFIDRNSSILGGKSDSGPTEVPDFNNIEEIIDIEQLNANQSNLSVLKGEDTESSARRHNFDVEQPKVRKTKSLRRKRVANDELKTKELRKCPAETGTTLETEVPRKKRIKGRPLEYGKGEKNTSGQLSDDESVHSVYEEAIHAPYRDQQFDAQEQPEVHQTQLRRHKRENDNERLRKLHPLRKSLAESGTSFEDGVRRSKRIKMRPLEYWKGERFLYGRVNESMKLIGVKYFSPGKNDTKLKVKPIILSNSSGYKDLLELAARH
ncbi:hypothetical protein F511_31321 [Dorcoceras hygrometricum]|uniref:Centromere protein C n=1 Tax=Dorcoceras hygrometricum TaxID=472368 RepID=A0A2Z7DBZ8_9LAMI|nr:hypothetical protein F511_31321 [Dorcoceras hygrometricum]